MSLGQNHWDLLWSTAGDEILEVRILDRWTKSISYCCVEASSVDSRRSKLDSAGPFFCLVGGRNSPTEGPGPVSKFRFIFLLLNLSSKQQSPKQTRALHLSIHRSKCLPSRRMSYFHALASLLLTSPSFIAIKPDGVQVHLHRNYSPLRFMN